MDIARLDSQLTGTAVGPDAPDWDGARQAWNLAVDQHPAAVAVPADAADVAAVVRFAAGNGLRVTAQGSGHAAATLDSLERTILVKTTSLRAVEIDAGGRTARVGSGVLAGDLAEAAGREGLAPLGGSSPDVAVGGYTLGGGLGWLGRAHGLACNAVRSAEVVTAASDVVRTDADTEPDLFWALRGGGGSFGIVTELELDLFELDEAFGGDVMYDAEHAPAVFRAFRDWSAGVGDEVTASARFLTPPPIPDVPEFMRGRPLVTVTGVNATGEDVFGPVRSVAEPVMDSFGPLAPAALCRVHGDPENPVPGIGGPSVLLNDLPDEAIDAIVDIAGPQSGSPLLQVDLRQLGGAVARPAEGGGVLSSLQGAFALVAIGVPMGPVTPEAVVSHLDRVREAAAPWSTGGTYLNFHETPSDGSTHFEADDYARLREVKRQYDPDGVIQGGHDVPAA